MNDQRVRVSIVGVVVIALFSALLGRLWFLQIGNTEKTVAVVAQNVTRTIQQESPRGLILDSNQSCQPRFAGGWQSAADGLEFFLILTAVP